MILQNEQIENFKLRGYHITTADQLENIKNKGLLPKCGERSKSIGDNQEAIYFFPTLILIKDWVKVLYEKKDREFLELLRFNLKTINFVARDIEFSDFYTTDSITPENIQLLQRIDLNGNPYYLENLLNQSKGSLIWKPIELLNDNETIKDSYSRKLII